MTDSKYSNEDTIDDIVLDIMNKRLERMISREELERVYGDIDVYRDLHAKQLAVAVGTQALLSSIVVALTAHSEGGAGFLARFHEQVSLFDKGMATRLKEQPDTLKIYRQFVGVVADPIIDALGTGDKADD